MHLDICSNKITLKNRKQRLIEIRADGTNWCTPLNSKRVLSFGIIGKMKPR